jgi:ElaB/YqjD/DUF883 family membrane-anchored ribosome-binding protein
MEVGDLGIIAVDDPRKRIEHQLVLVIEIVKDQPMATLAMAAAVGFVLGAIWKS